jgi:hypothetical protein
MNQLIIALLALATNFTLANDRTIIIENGSEQIKVVQKACGVKTINLQKLDTRIEALLLKAETEEDLNNLYGFLFKVADETDFDKVRKLGIKVVSEIGTIGTARGNLCQILRLSALPGLISVQGSSRIWPQ